MSILFDDTSSSKKRPNKSKGSIFKTSGLSVKGALPATPLGDNLFDAPAPKKPVSASKPTMHVSQSDDCIATIDSYIQDHPNIKPYVMLITIEDSFLTSEEVTRKIKDSAVISTGNLAVFAVRAATIREKIDNKKTTLGQQFNATKRPPGASFYHTGLIYLDFALHQDLLDLEWENCHSIDEIKSDISGLLDIVQTRKSHKEIKINISLLELKLDSFVSTNPQYLLTIQRRKTIKHMLASQTTEVNLNKMVDRVKELFNPNTTYFIDDGSTQNTFEIIVAQMEKDDKESLSKKILRAVERPNLIGQLILASAKEFISKRDLSQDDVLQYFFILFTRYYFNEMICFHLKNDILRCNISEFSRRVQTLLYLSPNEIGLTQNFLPEKLKSIPLNIFPEDPSVNKYANAISLLRTLPFFYCPLDFCHRFHECLKIIQETASQYSYEEKLKKTGKLYAKSDHLLCLDDLFDITLLLLLLADPVPIYPIIFTFHPFINGLEMTAELEFAYTNIHAMIQHILELNMDELVHTAKTRSEENLDIDPLHILS